MLILEFLKIYNNIINNPNDKDYLNNYIDKNLLNIAYLNSLTIINEILFPNIINKISSRIESNYNRKDNTIETNSKKIHQKSNNDFHLLPNNEK
jgi:hypothetical protein